MTMYPDNEPTIDEHTLINRIFTLLGNKKSNPPKCIYEERIKCFNKLIEIQKNLKSADEEYVNVSIIEGKGHENAWNRMEAYTKEYRNEYERCEKIIKH